MCQHSYWYEGFKQRGADLPGYAIGTYFPGDEPGMRCKIGDYCCEEECPRGEEYWQENGSEDAPEEPYEEKCWWRYC